MGRPVVGEDLRLHAWPLALGPEEVRLAASLVGRRLSSIEYEADGDIESAYLRFGDQVIAVAAVDYGASSGPAWPWRLALLEAPEPLPPTDTKLNDLGRIEIVEFYADEADVERAIALRLVDGREVLLDSAGGDYVRASLERPEELVRWRRTRLYA